MFLTDGYRTIFTFAALPGVFLREKEVTPPGYSVGAIDTTTMLNGAGNSVVGGAGVTGARSKAPKSLTDITDMSGQASYDPLAYSQLVGILGFVNRITVTFPDGAILPFYGWLDEFKPATLKEGDFPLAEFKIVPTGTNGLVAAARGRIDVTLGAVVGGAFPGLVVG